MAPLSNRDTRFQEGAAFLGDLIQLEQQSLSGYERNRHFQNLGGNRFADTGAIAGTDLIQDGRGVAAGDLDNDGDLDLAVANRNAPQLVILRNDLPGPGRWLAVRLQGTRSNRQGIGARLRLRAGDRIQAREVQLGSGFVSQSDPTAWFGLGSAASAESLEIVWPSGTRQSLDSLDAGRIHTVREP